MTEVLMINHTENMDNNSASGNQSSGASGFAFPDQDLFTTVSQASLGLIGFAGNLSVLVALGTNKKLRNKIVNIYIINQVSSSCIWLWS